MTRERIRLLAFAAFLALGVAAVLGLRSSSDPQDPSLSARAAPGPERNVGFAGTDGPVEPARTTSTSGNGERPSGDLRYAWRVGDVSGYDLSYRQQVRVGRSGALLEGAEEAPADIEHAVSFGLRGRLTVSVYATVPAGLLVGWRFERLALTGSAGENVFGPEQLREAAGRLEVEALSVVSPRGEIHTLRLPDSARPEGVNQIKAVLACFRIVLDDPAATEWSSAEEDLLGAYTARHRRAPAGAGLVGIEKTKGYHTIHDVAGRTGQLEIESDILVRAGLRLETGVLESIEGRESVILTGRETAYRMESRIESSFRLVESEIGTGAHPAGAHRLADHERWRAWDGFAAEAAGAIHARQQEADERALARQVSFDEILQDVETSGKDRFHELSVLLKHDEGSRQRALEILRSSPGDTKVASALVGALAGAGTPAAQAVLLEVVEEAGVHEAVRLTALTAVAVVDEPRPDLTARLRALADPASPRDPVGLAALELLGAVGRPRRHPVDPDVLAFLERSIGRSEDPSWKSAALRGLGNAGDARSFEFLAAQAEHELSEVRSAASLALRKMPRDKALPLLERAMFSDPSESVRASAAAAIDAMND